MLSDEELATLRAPQQRDANGVSQPQDAPVNQGATSKPIGVRRPRKPFRMPVGMFICGGRSPYK